MSKRKRIMRVKGFDDSDRQRHERVKQIKRELNENKSKTDRMWFELQLMVRRSL